MLNTKLLGSVSAAPSEYVEDVFSTYLYTGNGSTQTITNGIDLAGKGGLVWTKGRSGGGDEHALFDTIRGDNSALSTQNTDTAQTETAFGSFLSNGFSFSGGGSWYNINQSTRTYCSWTFRKAPKFFDVVTYTGNGASDQTISHNLGSTPGFIVVKATNATSSWWCYHRGTTTPNNFQLRLNSTAAAGDTGGNAWNVTSTTFNASGPSLLNINVSGTTYVAYLFAHNAGGFGAAGTDNVISCGSFTTDGSGTATVNLGYEPQYVLWKQTDGADNWYVNDVMRGMSVDSSDRNLSPNTGGAESAGGYETDPTATGFIANPGIASKTYIYMAIRRPMKPPTSGTQVFSVVARTGTGTTTTVSAGFAPDSVLIGDRDGVTGYGAVFWDRLRGAGVQLRTPFTNAEQTATTSVTGFNNTGIDVGADTGNRSANYSSYNYINYFFRRATGFFDTVCYTGTGTNRTVTHNLGVVPELIIVKRRNIAIAWAVYANNDNTDYLVLNTTAATADNDAYWNDTTPTSSVFSLGTTSIVNNNADTYVAYLFATLAGISKVGSYTGNGSNQTINCGFTAGARFVMIKRIDSTGDWYVWDTARGIVNGNDPYLLLNSDAAEVTNTDYIDPANSGFEISSTAPAAINANGGSFIFLAIA